MNWPLRNWNESWSDAGRAIMTGPCAWSLAALRIPAVPAFPSLVIVTPEDTDESLRELGPRAAAMPVMLVVNEPMFSRRLHDDVMRRLDALGRACVEVLTIRTEDPQDLKGGGSLQTVQKLRERKTVGELGLATHDVRQAEWMAIHTHARVLMMPYGLSDPSARHRAIPAAIEHGMCVVATPPITHDTPDASFALAESHRALPILDAPPSVPPMSPGEVEAAWSAWHATHPAPAPLPRSLPPE